MRYIINDEKYHFKFAFDTETGAYVRTGVCTIQIFPIFQKTKTSGGKKCLQIFQQKSK